MQWAGRDGTNRTDTVYSSSLKSHWDNVAKHDLNPDTKYYISVQPFMYREAATMSKQIVDMMEPVLSPTESLTLKHYQKLQRMAWQVQQRVALDVTPPVDVHNPVDFRAWNMQINSIASTQHANDFAAALLDYYRQRQSANDVMLAAWNGEEQKENLEEHVALLGEAINTLDVEFKAAFPTVRCIDDLPKTQELVLM